MKESSSDATPHDAHYSHHHHHLIFPDRSILTISMEVPDYRMKHFQTNNKLSSSEELEIKLVHSVNHMNNLE